MIMLTKFFYRFSILFLIGLFIVFRFFRLGQTPPGVFVDEASFGVEANSILHTAHDTWGRFLPLEFKAFGEYKAGGLVYVLVPLIKIFGLQPFTTRLPSAISGLGVLLIFYLTLRLFWPRTSSLLLIFATSFLAFAPWHFGLSRLFFEANVGFIFYALGIYFAFSFLRRHQSSHLLFMVASFSLAGYFYATFRYLGLGTVVFVYLLSLRSKSPLLFLKVSLVGLLLSLGWLSFLFSSHSFQRIQQEGNKYQFSRVLTIDQARKTCFLTFNRDPHLSKFCYFIWNKPILYFYQVINSFIEQSSGYYLFLHSPANYVVSPNWGMYSRFLWPFYLIGLYLLFKGVAHRRKLYLLLLFLLFFSQLPSVILAQTSLHRNIVNLYLFGLILAFGFLKAFSFLRHYSLRLAIVFVLIFSFFFGLDTVRFLSDYFLNYTQQNPLLWQADITQVFNYLKTQQNHHYRIIDHSFGPLYAAYFGLISPKAYQQAERYSPSDNGWIHVKRVGDYSSEGGNLTDLLCQKYHHPDSFQPTLLIASPDSKWLEYADLVTKPFSGAVPIHVIYNIDHVYQRLGNDIHSYCGW